MTLDPAEPTEAEARLALAAGFAQADQQTGHFNLAIFGMTGVGKSTLVNTIFGADLARTGVGRPVTKGSQLHRTTGSRMGIYDTEGLEIGRDSAEIVAGLQRQIEDSHAGPLADQIHVVWYCVRASDRRFTQTEADFVRHICKLGPPVLLVMTRTALTSGGLPPDTRELADHIGRERLPVFGKPVYFVNAKPDEWAGVPAHGLDDLLKATSAAAPLGVQRALNAVQRIDGARKLAQANQLVQASAESLQLRSVLMNVRKTWAAMIAGTAIIYGLPEKQATEAALQCREIPAMHRLLYWGQASVLALPLRYVVLRGVRARRSSADSAGKQAPAGAGQKTVPTKRWTRKRNRQRMGSGLSAGIVTLAVGEAWVAVCDRAYRASYPEPPELKPDLFADEFSAELSSRMNRSLRAWQRFRDR